MTTPIRAALITTSTLLVKVADGLGGLKRLHVSEHLEESIRASFQDSLDLDKGLTKGREQENRWDYLLGHSNSRRIIGLEPHSAKTDQISKVIAKRKAAIDQLRDHLKAHARVAAWLWVASGKVAFADTERARLLLDQNGIRFVGRMVLPKHLPSSPPPTPTRKASLRR
jgi:hypothetical protein